MNHPGLFDQPAPGPDSFGLFPLWHNVRRPMPITTIIAPAKLARTTQPDTAHQAARNASRRGPTQRMRVWEALRNLGDATDYELAQHLGILRSSAAKRRQELLDLGYVVGTPFRRPTDTGSAAVVWRLSLAPPSPSPDQPPTPTPST